MILERQKVLRCRRAMHASHAAYRRSSEVQCHRHAIFLSQVSDLVRLENAAGSREVRMDLADRMFFAKDFEWLFQIDVLSSEDRSRTLVGNLFEQIGVHPRNYVFHAREVVFLVGLAKPD